jgi:hypothetical protein
VTRGSDQGRGKRAPAGVGSFLVLDIIFVLAVVVLIAGVALIAKAVERL